MVPITPLRTTGWASARPFLLSRRARRGLTPPPAPSLYPKPFALLHHPMIGRPNETTIRQRAWALVEPVCLDAGYEVVDVRFVTEQSGWVLRSTS